MSKINDNSFSLTVQKYGLGNKNIQILLLNIHRHVKSHNLFEYHSLKFTDKIKITGLNKKHEYYENMAPFFKNIYNVFLEINIFNVRVIFRDNGTVSVSCSSLDSCRQ